MKKREYDKIIIKLIDLLSVKLRSVMNGDIRSAGDADKEAVKTVNKFIYAAVHDFVTPYDRNDITTIAFGFSKVILLMPHIDKKTYDCSQSIIDGMKKCFSGNNNYTYTDIIVSSGDTNDIRMKIWLSQLVECYEALFRITETGI